MMIGGLAIAGSMYWLSYITPHTTYSTIIWPLLLMAAGAGFSFVSIFPTATHKVPHSKAGMASALVNVGQQVGGTIGLSSLVTLAVAAGRSKFDSLKPALAVHQLTVSQAVTEATVRGWAMGFRLAAAFGLAAFLIATVVVKRLEAQDVAGTESPGIAA
jgi:hypothetical protein